MYNEVSCARLGILNAFFFKKKKEGNWIQYLKMFPEADMLLQFSYFKQKFSEYIINKTNKQTNQNQTKTHQNLSSS